MRNLLINFTGIFTHIYFNALLPSRPDIIAPKLSEHIFILPVQRAHIFSSPRSNPEEVEKTLVDSFADKALH